LAFIDADDAKRPGRSTSTGSFDPGMTPIRRPEAAAYAPSKTIGWSGATTMVSCRGRTLISQRHFIPLDDVTS
jgi:hypothetical protein